MSLSFSKAKTHQEIQSIVNYNIDAFVDSPDFSWDLKSIKKEIEDGWEVYGVSFEKEIIAAVFVKVNKDSLFTKNTAVKINHQGSGYSHQIKDFFELRARELKLQMIFHFCRIDDFRMYSLNESHGYKKTSRKLGKNGEVVEWKKQLNE
ncbi:MAG: hypothetical protein VYD54_12575 [Bdellovibrionota bacterium]|nr:hypothetical protein [Bdellovibrionota bacterium]